MSGPDNSSAVARDFRATMMYHPSHHVPDLAEAENWFLRVFGRPSTSLASLSGDKPPRPGYPNDYSTFTPISDVLFDTIDPKRYVLLGVQRYPTVDQPHLKGFGWYFEGMTELFHALTRHGFQIISQVDELAEGDDPPTAAGSAMPLYFSVPEDAGLRYEFFPAIPFPLDPRIAPGWTVPPVADDDPLGIERCSHHTVLTGDPERALRLIVDVLGGDIVHRGSRRPPRHNRYLRLAGRLHPRLRGTRSRDTGPRRLGQGRSERHLPCDHLEGRRPRARRTSPRGTRCAHCQAIR